MVVPEGELYGFLGPNGAGKTTTMRVLNGLLRPSSGEVRILGRDVYARPGSQAWREVRAATAFVPDTPPLYEYLTGAQFVAFVGSLYDADEGELSADRGRLFELFELSGAADQLCRGYSHGMQKKLYLTAMLATRPRVLFLDEPTTGLDPRTARRLKDLLLELRESGTTIFLTTHLLTLAEELCDRVGILSGGRLLAEGTVGELHANSSQAQTLGGSGGSASSDLEAVFLELTREQVASSEQHAPDPTLRGSQDVEAPGS